MNIQNFCCAVGFLIILVNLGFGQVPAPVSGYDPALETARKSYKTLCADCHGDDGQGKEYRDSGISIPEFTSKPWFQNKSNTQLKLAVLLGKGTEMPPFEEELSADEANHLVALLRSFAGLNTSADRRESSGSDKVLQKELERFQKEWGQLASRWELEFNSLRELSSKRPNSKLIR